MLAESREQRGEQELHQRDEVHRAAAQRLADFEAGKFDWRRRRFRREAFGLYLRGRARPHERNHQWDDEEKHRRGHQK